MLNSLTVYDQLDSSIEKVKISNIYFICLHIYLLFSAIFFLVHVFSIFFNTKTGTMLVLYLQSHIFQFLVCRIQIQPSFLGRIFHPSSLIGFIPWTHYEHRMQIIFFLQKISRSSIVSIL